MTDKDVDKETSIARAVDSGNFDNAYVSEDLETAWEKDQESDNPTLEKYKDAYILAFFATYETHEIPLVYLSEYMEARDSELGQKVRKDYDLGNA